MSYNKIPMSVLHDAVNRLPSYGFVGEVEVSEIESSNDSEIVENFFDVVRELFPYDDGDYKTMVPISWYEHLKSRQIIIGGRKIAEERNIEEPVCMRGSKWCMENKYSTKRGYWQSVLDRFLSIYKPDILDEETANNFLKRLYEMGFGSGTNYHWYSHEFYSENRRKVTLKGKVVEVSPAQFIFVRKAKNEMQKFERKFLNMEREIKDAEAGILRKKNYRAKRPQGIDAVSI